MVSMDISLTPSLSGATLSLSSSLNKRVLSDYMRVCFFGRLRLRQKEGVTRISKSKRDRLKKIAVFLFSRDLSWLLEGSGGFFHPLRSMARSTAVPSNCGWTHTMAATFTTDKNTLASVDDFTFKHLILTLGVDFEARGVEPPRGLAPAVLHGTARAAAMCTHARTLCVTPHCFFCSSDTHRAEGTCRPSRSSSA